jgi:phenylalanyl-tRNA synthetase beta chain
MKFTLSWLEDHLITDASLDEILETLTRIGLEVESVWNPGRDLAPFVVGHVVEARQHPNADRLRLCLIDTGSGEPVQVVCGAPNARTGMKGVFAAVGTTIPGTGMALKAGNIRGEASNGMLCSEREMGLSEEHEGIIELPDDAPVGQPFAPVMGLDDPVIDVAVTPNRQDCLGVYGIARDLAAAGLGELREFAPAPVAGSFDSPIKVDLDLLAESPEACPCFVGRYFRGVKNGPSPAWMQRRLRAIGLRPISALVDITNYVTYDLGRPLHVFDAKTVTGNIRPRLARDGETMLALNGKEYTLDATMTVIADEAKAEGLGGVMGGETSGCTEATTDVFLEVALFDPLRTAATGRKLQIESDARYRFERGVDPAMVIPGAEHATRLIQQLCGGAASALVIAGSPEVPPTEVIFRPDRVRTLGGLELDPERQAGILEALGFALDRGDPDRWRVVAPTWRSDVEGEADIVEEVCRIHGLDKVPSVPLPREQVISLPSLSAGQRRVPRAKRALAARGMVECVTWSFTSSAWAALFGGNALKLANPISADLDQMRPSVLPNLLLAAQRNHARGYADLALFEAGPAYRTDKPDGQDLVAGGIRTGQVVGRHWAGGARPVDAFDAKADAIAALAAAGAPVDNLQVVAEAPAWYHPGQSGTLRLGPQNVLAYFGVLHPKVLRAMDVKGPVAGFEAFVEKTPLPKAKAGRAKPRVALSPYQAVERDFAFVVGRDVPADAILRAAKSADKMLIEAAEVFDVYTGTGIADDAKSVAIAVRLQPRERTLTDAEIDAVATKVVAAVSKATGATLRG